jgi:hypothetical protein
MGRVPFRPGRWFESRDPVPVALAGGMKRLIESISAPDSGHILKEQCHERSCEYLP